MSKVENLQTINRAKPFPCVSVALAVLAMFVLSWLAAKGVRNNLQTLLVSICIWFAALVWACTRVRPTMSAAQGSVRSGAAVGALLHLGGPLLKSKSSELTEL